MTNRLFYCIFQSYRSTNILIAKRKLIGRIDPETGEIKPTDGRGRKKVDTEGKNLDYKEAYEKLLQKYESQEVLLESLKKELAKYKAAE